MRRSVERKVFTCWLITSSLCSLRCVRSHSVARDDGSIRNGQATLWEKTVRKLFILRNPQQSVECVNVFQVFHSVEAVISYNCKLISTIVALYWASWNKGSLYHIFPFFCLSFCTWLYHTYSNHLSLFKREFIMNNCYKHLIWKIKCHIFIFSTF